MAILKTVAAALGLTVLASGAWAQSCPQPGNVQSMVSGLATGLNQVRVANGLRPIDFNSQLSRAAQVQACDMARTGQFEHRGSDGSSSHTRVMRAGYNSCLTAENLAWGFPRAGQIINGWMGSPGHRRNMLHAEVDAYGVGVANSSQGPIWVLVVARSC